MKQMYKSLVIPHLDYCSQLWMPVEISEIEKLEKLQRDYFRKIPELKHMNYWENLKKMKMLSLQRRMERYRVIYCWKVLAGLAPNCGLSEIEGSAETRLGRRLKVPKNDSNPKCEKMRDQSFQQNGPLLFNSIPAKVRNMKNCTVDEFKAELDTYLATVPDEPKMDGQNPNCSDNKGKLGKFTNSMIFQCRRSQVGGHWG